MDWTVDGISGGSPQVGTVDPTGLYVAPAQAPPGGQVTIRATTAAGAFDEVTIADHGPAASAARAVGGRRQRTAVEVAPPGGHRARAGASAGSGWRWWAMPSS